MPRVVFGAAAWLRPSFPAEQRPAHDADGTASPARPEDAETEGETDADAADPAETTAEQRRDLLESVASRGLCPKLHAEFVPELAAQFEALTQVAASAQAFPALVLRAWLLLRGVRGARGVRWLGPLLVDQLEDLRKARAAGEPGAEGSFKGWSGVKTRWSEAELVHPFIAM